MSREIDAVRQMYPNLVFDVAPSITPEVLPDRPVEREFVMVNDGRGEAVWGKPGEPAVLRLLPGRAVTLPLNNTRHVAVQSEGGVAVAIDDAAAPFLMALLRRTEDA